MTEQQVVSDINWLYAKLSARDQKYLRNYNRFMSNGMRREGIRTIYTTPSSFFNFQTDDDMGLLPSVNVGRSMVLTLQSKLIQTKGRIFFNPVNGLWKTIKTCRNSQIYFDLAAERDNLNTKMGMIALDAFIFEMGVLWINDEEKGTMRIPPWQYYVDPAEANYGKYSRCMLMQEDFPLISIKDKLAGKQSESLLKDNEHVKVKLYRYWDLVGKKKYTIVNSDIIETVDIEYTKPPFVTFYYNNPIKGLYSNSIMDNAYQNQRQIDDILRRIHDALTLSPANTIYVPKSATNANVAKMLSNKVGNVIDYDAALGAVVVSTPPAIDAQYLTMLQYFTQTTYEQEGISMLSAQSKKPSGINSGVALDTLQDVESERFQAQVDQFIQAYKDVFSTMIDVYPENDDILPQRLNRANIKWSEIKKQRDMFSMQSSLASVLSKDPKVKMEQLEKMVAMKAISPDMAAELQELPDLEGAYNSATASSDDCYKIIERALDDDVYDFYPFINLKQLLDKSVNMLLRLDSVDEDPRVLQRMVKLIEKVTEMLNQTTNLQNPPLPPPVPIVPPVKDVTMDGKQIDALLLVIGQVKAGTLTPDEANALIMSVFPNISPDLINQMLGMPAPAANPDQTDPNGSPTNGPIQPGPAPAMPSLPANQAPVLPTAAGGINGIQ